MNAKGGALVEEAKKLMAQGNDDGDNQEEEPEAKGPKIKMRTRLGKNKKKPASPESAPPPGVKVPQGQDCETLICGACKAVVEEFSTSFL